MDSLAQSPCQEFGVSPDGSAFPCLKKGWGERPCPTDAACRGWMKTRQAQMYGLGYPYAAWVVRKKMFGFAKCTLEFVREAPTTKNTEELFGQGVLRVTRAG